MTELEREAELEAERFDSGAEYHPVPLRNVREVRVTYRHIGRLKPRKHAAMPSTDTATSERAP